MRPWSIILYERLYLALIALGVVMTVLTWPMIRASAAMTAAQTGVPVRAVLGIRSGWPLAITLLSLLLLYLTARRGSNIARFAAAAWFLLSLIGAVSALVLGMPWTIQLIVGAQVLLEVVLLYLLFGTDDGNDWFRSRGGRR